MEEWLNTLDEKERQEMVEWAEQVNPLTLQELKELDDKFFNEGQGPGEVNE